MTFFPVEGSKMFVLNDFKYWAEHEKELDEWCEQNECQRRGFTVVAFTERGYMLFILRWL